MTKQNCQNRREGTQFTLTFRRINVYCISQNANSRRAAIDAAAGKIEAQTIAWRRDLQRSRFSCGHHDEHVRFRLVHHQSAWERLITGTMRTLDTGMQRDIHERIRRTVTKIAESAGATAEISIENKTPITYNDPVLVKAVLPSMQRTAGESNVIWMDAMIGSAI